MARLAADGPDGSRDLRADDPSNVWLIHPAGRLLLPVALRLGLSANAASLAGLMLGAAAAAAYARWPDWRWATAGFLLCVGWLIADGLDGMIARATGTSTAFGRFLDGVCDHLVFAMLYVVLAWSIGGAQAWLLAAAAGVAHGIQSSLYEGERMRQLRRASGEAAVAAAPSANPAVRAYDALSGGADRWARPFDSALRRAADADALGRAYADAAAPILRRMSALSNNARILILYLACVAASPHWFWWIELGPMSLLACWGIVRLRQVERQSLKVEY